MATTYYTPGGMIAEGTIEEIAIERQYQVFEKGYDADHDDTIFPHQWVEYISKYVYAADTAMEPEDYRKNLVKVAALAVAAIESFDRLS